MEEFNIFFGENFRMIMMLLATSLIVGYLFGSIPVAYLYCKAHNVDILNFGSGNPGSTNVARALGKKHGRIVFIFDILKIVIPVFVLRLIFFNFVSLEFKTFLSSLKEVVNLEAYNNLIKEPIYGHYKFYRDFIAIYTGLGGIIGHNYPLFLNFKGGKGISCTMGAILSFNFIYAILLFLCYKIVTKITKYVSLGSLSGVTLFFLTSLFSIIKNIMPYHYNNSMRYGMILLPGIFIMWFLAIFRHRENIKRLINGTENKTE